MFLDSFTCLGPFYQKASGAPVRHVDGGRTPVVALVPPPVASAPAPALPSAPSPAVSTATPILVSSSPSQSSGAARHAERHGMKPAATDVEHDAEEWQQLRKFVTVIADTAMNSRRKMVESCAEHISKLQERHQQSLQEARAEKASLQAELSRVRELAQATAGKS
eukprot:2258978-Amphidinium_carterae.2